MLRVSEVSVKMMMGRSVLMLIATCFLATACSRSKDAQVPATAVTQTVAPAAAPSAPNGTDAMTQTVDVEDSRSEAEGGTLDNTQTSTTSTATTTTKASPKTAPKPTKRKK